MAELWRTLNDKTEGNNWEKVFEDEPDLLLCDQEHEILSTRHQKNEAAKKAKDEDGRYREDGSISFKRKRK